MALRLRLNPVSPCPVRPLTTAQARCVHAYRHPNIVYSIADHSITGLSFPAVYFCGYDRANPNPPVAAYQAFIPGLPPTDCVEYDQSQRPQACATGNISSMATFPGMGACTLYNMSGVRAKTDATLLNIVLAAPPLADGSIDGCLVFVQGEATDKRGTELRPTGGQENWFTVTTDSLPYGAFSSIQWKVQDRLFRNGTVGRSWVDPPAPQALHWRRCDGRVRPAEGPGVHRCVPSAFLPTCSRGVRFRVPACVLRKRAAVGARAGIKRRAYRARRSKAMRKTHI